MDRDLTVLLAGYGLEVKELVDDTGTAASAARALGVPVASIVKSLVCLVDELPRLLMASGDRRVDLERMAGAIDASTVRLATAREVKALTGFAIGGVPPLGHALPMASYMDERLLGQERVFAAAGTRHRIFGVHPHRLRDLTGARVIDLGEDDPLAGGSASGSMGGESGGLVSGAEGHVLGQRLSVPPDSE